MERNQAIGLNKGIVVKWLSGGAFVAALVFICAGRLYWQGILYCALTVSMLIVSFLLVAHYPGLINERLKPGKGTKGWDKVYWALSTPLFFITIALSALDSGRLRLSPNCPCMYMVLLHSFITWAI